MTVASFGCRLEDLVGRADRLDPLALDQDRPVVEDPARPGVDQATGLDDRGLWGLPTSWAVPIAPVMTRAAASRAMAVGRTSVSPGCRTRRTRLSRPRAGGKECHRPRAGMIPGDPDPTIRPRPVPGASVVPGPDSTRIAAGLPGVVRSYGRRRSESARRAGRGDRPGYT